MPVIHFYKYSNGGNQKMGQVDNPAMLTPPPVILTPLQE
jgi:hypothetical protein